MVKKKIFKSKIIVAAWNWPSLLVQSTLHHTIKIKVYKLKYLKKNISKFVDLLDKRYIVKDNLKNLIYFSLFKIYENVKIK